MAEVPVQYERHHLFIEKEKQKGNFIEIDSIIEAFTNR
jgi:hypothetical protein